MGCSGSKGQTDPSDPSQHRLARKSRLSEGHGRSLEVLAKETYFSLDEVKALQTHFRKLSNSLHHDGVIHQDEFALALFKTTGQSNIFVDRVFQSFDLKKNQVVDFEEFIRSLSIFHPRAPLEAKADFAFRIYDLDNTGWIEPGEIKRLMAALLSDNPAIMLSEADLDQIVDQTIIEADLAGDGHISPTEWQALVRRTPDIINYMTLPVLQQVTTRYPSFLFENTQGG